MSTTHRSDGESPHASDAPLGLDGVWDYAFTDSHLPAPTRARSFDPCAGCTGCEGLDRFCFNHR